MVLKRIPTSLLSRNLLFFLFLYFQYSRFLLPQQNRVCYFAVEGCTTQVLFYVRNVYSLLIVIRKNLYKVSFQLIGCWLWTWGLHLHSLFSFILHSTFCRGSSSVLVYIAISDRSLTFVVVLTHIRFLSLTASTIMPDFAWDINSKRPE